MGNQTQSDQIKISLRQISETTSEASIRDHRVRFDRPVAKGGADGGPMGGEVFLASVAGCFLSNFLAAIRARHLAVSGVRVEVTGTLGGTPARFVAVDLAIASDNSDRETPDRETMLKLIGIASSGCILVNTLRDALNLSIRLA